MIVVEKEDRLRDRKLLEEDLRSGRVRFDQKANRIPWVSTEKKG